MKETKNILPEIIGLGLIFIGVCLMENSTEKKKNLEQLNDLLCQKEFDMHLKKELENRNIVTKD